MHWISYVVCQWQEDIGTSTDGNVLKSLDETVNPPLWIVAEQEILRGQSLTPISKDPGRAVE